MIYFSRTLTLLVLLVGILYGQNPATPAFPTTVATDNQLFVASNRATTTLSTTLTSIATNISVANTSAFTMPAIISIESEQIAVCSKTSTTFTVCSGGRGYDGSSAAAHASGRAVSGSIAARYHNQAAAEIIAIETLLGAGATNRGTGVAIVRSTGSSPTTDSISKFDSNDNLVEAVAGTDFSKPNTSETTSGDRVILGTLNAGSASRTAPLKVGTTPPATCIIGDLFYDSDATSGQNVYGCTSTNTWTLQAGSGGGGFWTSMGNQSGTPTYDASTCGAGAVCTFALTLTGNVTGGTLTKPSSGTGQVIVFRITQDGTGIRTFTCPANVTNCPSPPAPDLSANSIVALTTVYDGSNAVFQRAEVIYSEALTCQNFYEALANGSNVYQLCAPSSLSADAKTILPANAGTAGYVLTSGGAGAQATWTAPSSGGAYASSCNGFTATMNGTDQTACTFANVPALSAGSCFKFEGLAFAAQNYQVKIKIDGTTIANPISSANGWGGNYISFNEMYCNNTGSQAAQSLYPIRMSYGTGYSQAGTSPANYWVEGSTGVAYPITPSAIDWTTTHTVTITINAVSGTGNVFAFRWGN